jgi:hypothetical protein
VRHKKNNVFRAYAHAAVKSESEESEESELESESGLQSTVRGPKRTSGAAQAKFK